MYQLRESGLVTLYVKKATNVYFFYLNEKKKKKKELSWNSYRIQGYLE